jgi:YHS domain-containing protein
MTATTIDPVCGMNVEPDEAAGESEFQGQTYYFCCSECKEQFDEDPTDYVSEGIAEQMTET